MSETLKEKTAKGLFWGGMNNFVQQVVGLVFGIILGRLLSPSDYGMIAMITIFSHHTEQWIRCCLDQSRPSYRRGL